MAQGRLLVLDDDATVGQILVLGAQSAGFEARWCEDLPALLVELGDWAPTHVSLDLGLPQANVEQVLQCLAEAACRARVIVCSGAAPADLQAALARAGQLGLPLAGILQKPFRLAELRRLLAPA